MNNKASTIQRVLNVWAIVLIIWSIYRTKLALPEWFDELIAKPLVFVLPVYYSIIKYEQKPFFEQIWLKKKDPTYRYSHRACDRFYIPYRGVFFFLIT
ncbi:MAG: hypothetical protein UZ22_OP11002000589 [Microgenomates bacterium OLB23]|nr:MAG: hypothetical protein UZ22_OP11002000589 [Microgenomates bacterium OLB23]